MSNQPALCPVTIRRRAEQHSLRQGIVLLHRWPQHPEVWMATAFQARPSPQRIAKVVAMEELEPLRSPHQTADLSRTAHLIVPDAAYRRELIAFAHLFN